MEVWGRFSCGCPTGGVRSRRPPLAPGATTRPDERPGAREKASCPPCRWSESPPPPPEAPHPLRHPPTPRPAFNSATVAITQRLRRGPGCHSPAAAGGHCAGASAGAGACRPRLSACSSQWHSSGGRRVQFEPGTARCPRLAGGVARSLRRLRRRAGSLRAGTGSPAPGRALCWQARSSKIIGSACLVYMELPLGILPVPGVQSCQLGRGGTSGVPGWLYSFFFVSSVILSVCLICKESGCKMKK